MLRSVSDSLEGNPTGTTRACKLASMLLAHAIGKNDLSDRQKDCPGRRKVDRKRDRRIEMRFDHHGFAERRAFRPTACVGRHEICTATQVISKASTSRCRDAIHPNFLRCVASHTRRLFSHSRSDLFTGNWLRPRRTTSLWLVRFHLASRLRYATRLRLRVLRQAITVRSQHGITRRFYPVIDRPGMPLLGRATTT